MLEVSRDAMEVEDALPRTGEEGEGAILTNEEFSVPPIWCRI